MTFERVLTEGFEMLCELVLSVGSESVDTVNESFLRRHSCYRLFHLLAFDVRDFLSFFLLYFALMGTFLISNF